MPSEPTYGGAVASAPIETNGSGRIEVGDRTIKTKVQQGKYSDLEALLPAKGDLTDDGYYVVSAVLDRDGSSGTLTQVLAPVYVVGFPGGGTRLPPDRWSLRSVSVDVPVERHVAWGGLSAYQKKYWRIAYGLEAAQGITSELANQWLQENPDGPGDPGNNTIANLRSLRETNGSMPVVIWYYQWTQTTFFVPPLSDGNIVQSPGGPGAPYLGSGLTWRRSPDNFDAPGNGTYTTVREWIGIPVSILEWNSYLFGT